MVVVMSVTEGFFKPVNLERIVRRKGDGYAQAFDVFLAPSAPRDLPPPFPGDNPGYTPLVELLSQGL